MHNFYLKKINDHGAVLNNIFVVASHPGEPGKVRKLRKKSQRNIRGFDGFSL